MTRWVIVILALVIGLIALNAELSDQADNSCGYTANEVMTAYEAGQFRAIHTRSTSLWLSPDSTHVFAIDEGLYRLSDGAFFDHFDFSWSFFSPDGQYLAHPGEGIYRISDRELVIPAKLERITIANGEHRVFTGNIAFSSNSEYVSITGAGLYREEADSQSTQGYGVFRLSDGKPIVESDSFDIEFSPDGNYAATVDGIFRLSDEQKLYATGVFSPDSSYASTRDGVFRLSDSAIVFNPRGDVYFTPDMSYAVAPSDGVYRISDGQHLYSLNYEGVYATPPKFSADGQYVAIPSDKLSSDSLEKTSIYRINDGALLFEINDISYPHFSPDRAMIAIDGDGIYRLSDQQKLFEIHGEVRNYSNQFSDDSMYVAAEYDGIYRVADGEKLFDLEGRRFYATFSPDGKYVAISDDGLYRINDQQKMFDIQGQVFSFTRDGDFVTAHGFDSSADLSIYRISDGHRFEHVRLLNTDCGILTVGNTILIIDPNQDRQRIAFIYIEIDDEPPLALLSERAGEYQIGFQGENRWISAEGATLFYIPE